MYSSSKVNLGKHRIRGRPHVHKGGGVWRAPPGRPGFRKSLSTSHLWLCFVFYQSFYSVGGQKMFFVYLVIYQSLPSLEAAEKNREITEKERVLGMGRELAAEMQPVGTVRAEEGQENWHAGGPEALGFCTERLQVPAARAGLSARQRRALRTAEGLDDRSAALRSAGTCIVRVYEAAAPPQSEHVHGISPVLETGSAEAAHHFLSL